MSSLNIQSTVELNNGLKMPILGYGTFRLDIGFASRDSVLTALKTGYKHIDTGAIYGNEQNVAEAIKQSGIPREEIFITDKVWNADQGFESTLKAFETSCQKLNTNYIDLYLIHWPVKGKRQDTWKALEKLYEEKRCRAIGVSNFTITHLDELLANSSIIPAANQVEFSPYTYQKDLLEYCNSKSIKLIAYSPLTKGMKLKDQKLIDVAEKYSKTPAQLLIRWAVQKGICIVSKSSKKDRIQDNPKIFDFEINEYDMGILDSFNENLRTGWNPHDREWA